MKASVTLTFHSFHRLPVELRLQIWHFAIPEGVYIHFYRRPTQEHVSQHLLARCSPHPVPSLLHTNSEARFVALLYFHILGDGPSRIYFNPNVDTLMLGLIFRMNCEALVNHPRTILGDSVAMIKHIAVCNTHFYGLWFQQRMFKNFNALQSFSMLDLREWNVDVEELRQALRPEVLRAENLVELRLKELVALRDCGRQGFGRLRRQVEDNWWDMSETKLEVKVLRLPFPGVQEWEEMKQRNPPRFVLKEEDGSNQAVTGPAKRVRRLHKPWRYLTNLSQSLLTTRL